MPGHAESYNPPAEYLFSAEEEKRWRDADPEDRKTDFIPQKYSSLRLVPAYAGLIRQQFVRCLDLYLCPRARRIRMNVNPDDLLPKLPSPRDLQPFPATQGVIYLGHTSRVTCITVDPTGQWLATGSDDTTVRLWELLSGRCMKVRSSL